MSTLVAAEAKLVTDSIRIHLDRALDELEEVAPLLVKARETEAHVALGYKSWPAYVQGEFGEQLARQAKLAQGPVIELLSSEGMSNRAIANTIGVSHTTVNRHVERDVPPGRSWKRDAIREANKVTGMDGKRYDRSLPKRDDLWKQDVEKATVAPKQPRRPLPDAYRDAMYDLCKVVERLERIHGDDRFQQNRDSLQTRPGGWSAMADITNRLTEMERHLNGVDTYLGEWSKRRLTKAELARIGSHLSEEDRADALMRKKPGEQERGGGRRNSEYAEQGVVVQR